MYPIIKLKPGKERSVKNYHPWVFSGAVGKIDDNLKEGDVCYLHNADNQFLATGHFHKSSILFRVLSFEKITIDKQYFIDGIQLAKTLRAQLNLLNNADTNAYRLVHGEGDNMSGLVIDIYNNNAVVQCHTRGMANHKNEIGIALQEVFNNQLETIYFRHAIHKENDSNENLFLHGENKSAVIKENTLQFNVDWIDGQKTGFFLDQRNNRNLLSQFCNGKKVLNTYCYTGGFSIYALHGGASLVHSVDSSAKAIDMLLQNVKLNFENANHESFCEDAGKFIKSMGHDYDVIILDPPAFAKNRDAIHNASIAYRNLNAEAIKNIKQGGIIFTFSCSQSIDKELFRKLVFQAAAMSNRKVRILYTLTQPADHPINIFHPEGEYLKGLVLHIE